MRFAWFKKQPLTIRAAIVAGILAITGAIVSALIPVIPALFGESSLQLVDVSFIDSGEFPVLDIKLRNTGDKIAFLKRADFEVEKIWTLEATVFPSAEEVSQNYNVILPLSGDPYSISKSISQSIKPNNVDRFTFTLGNDGGGPPRFYVYLMTVKLVYDEDDKSLKTQRLLFVTERAGPPLSFALMGPFAKDRFIKNQGIMTEINEIDAMKSERLKETISYFAEASFED